VRLGTLYLAYGYALIPLSLAAWMAFTLAVVAPNLSYIPRVLSDPLGWGWDLFATRETTWTWVPLGLLPWAQVGLVLAGLWGSVRAARRAVTAAIGEAGAGHRGLAPVVAHQALLAWVFLALYLS
jgi:hypothetical protein